MLTLRFKFDHCHDSKATPAALRVRDNSSGLRLQGDLLHVPADRDHSFRFGRHWSCDVFLWEADAFASGVARQHLQIEVTSQLCFIRDLATKNGTRLNGQYVGGRPDPHQSPASRIPSGRKQIKAGDVISLPGISLTVVSVPAVLPRPARPDSPPSSSCGHPTSQASATGSGVLQLPPTANFTSDATPCSPPQLEVFRFAGTLGGKPASGLTYLYERVKGKGAGHEKWVVKYFSVHSSADLNSLRHHISRLFSVENAALHRPCAYFLEPGARPAHLALCFPYLNSVNLAHEPLLDLAQIHDVMSASLDALAALHQQGLTHGHLCADNIFRGTGGRLAITDSGLNTVRSLIAAEMTGPAPSPGNDLMALGDLCLNLLGETTAPQRSRRGQQLDQKRAWPGGPLHDLACRLRQDPPLTASQAWQQMQEVPRPQVNRLVTVPQWKSPRKGPDWPG